MNKVTVLISIAIIGFAAQASIFKWGAANIYDGTGETAEKLTEGTAYLFATSAYTQKELYDKIVQLKTFDCASESIGTLSVNSSGGITSAPTEWADAIVGTDYDLYFAIVKNDKIYFSNIKTAGANSGETPATVAFGTQAPTSGPSSKFTTTNYESPGQWANINSGDVPEPTTCSLILVGLAGMGLKRLRKRGKKSA